MWLLLLWYCIRTEAQAVRIVVTYVVERVSEMVGVTGARTRVWTDICSAPEVRWRVLRPELKDRVLCVVVHGIEM